MKKCIFLIIAGTITTLLSCIGIRTIDNSSSQAQFSEPEMDSAYYRVELGKQLFYDPILSRDSSVSCATCHKQKLAFTDGLKVGVGIRGQKLTRNSPTLTNVINRPYLLIDGVNPSLESQVLVPISEHKEFDFHVLLAVDRLNKIKKYSTLSIMAYGLEINPKILTSAIAEFERTLVSYNSPYDKYIGGDKNALTASQIRGEDLFLNTLYCAKCHNGSDFTNDALTNNGLYKVYSDIGRMRMTENEKDRAIFKVPTLRNIEVTAPYMHNGSFTSLLDVIRHYEEGGKDNKNQSQLIQPFTLTNQEEIDLVNFLNSLTDTEFLSNPKFGIEE
ncbi:MAG: cytochrome c peroxidase [Parvicella sp.]|jgi:cytochrome c peroxidase